MENQKEHAQQRTQSSKGPEAGKSMAGSSWGEKEESQLFPPNVHDDHDYLIIKKCYLEKIVHIL